MGVKFSIITVCFNSIGTIEDTIESIKMQTYKNYEHIVIDGKSIDGTLEILKKYDSEYDNVRLVSERDTGIYNAMNKGISLATGDLIVFLNSDDTFESNALEIINNYYTPETDIIYGDVCWEEIFKKNRYIKRLNLKPNNSEKNNVQIMSENHLNKIKNAHNATFVKTNIMKNNLFDESLKICSDYKFFLKMYKQKRTVLYIPYVITTMKMGGVSTTQLKKSLEEHVKCEIDVLGNTSINIKKVNRQFNKEKYIKFVCRKIMPRSIYIKYRYIQRGWKLI